MEAPVKDHTPYHRGPGAGCANPQDHGGRQRRHYSKTASTSSAVTAASSLFMVALGPDRLPDGVPLAAIAYPVDRTRGRNEISCRTRIIWTLEPSPMLAGRS